MGMEITYNPHPPVSPVAGYPLFSITGFIRKMLSPLAFLPELQVGLFTPAQSVDSVTGLEAHQSAARAQAEFQPFTQKRVLLGLFITLEHLVVGILVTLTQVTVALERQHFGHLGIVVKPHGNRGLGHPVVEQGFLRHCHSGGVAAALYHGNAHLAQLVGIGVHAEQPLVLVVQGRQQTDQPVVIDFAITQHFPQVRCVAPFLYCHFSCNRW